MAAWEVLVGDCRDAMALTMADNSVDAIVTDPPYELGFMGKTWDASGIAYDQSVWREALRVLKPGGYMLAFSGSRTYHRMVVAIEDAGFEIRDQLMWLYGSGFPKSLDVSKAIDKSRASLRFDDIRSYLRGAMAAAGVTQVQIKAHLGYPADSGVVSHWVANSQPGVPGWRDWCGMKSLLPLDDRFDALIQTAEREKIGEKSSGIANSAEGVRHTIGASSSVMVDVTAPATPEAERWSGWGTALKPAHEPIVLARKPLIGTVAANVLAHGTGALNIDGCRVGTADDLNGGAYTEGRQPRAMAPGGAARSAQPGAYSQPAGRWPANVMHDGSDEVVDMFPSPHGAGAARSGKFGGEYDATSYDLGGAREMGRFGDSGSAARFFYCPKASRKDRNDGGDNAHPTVKPTELMRYLCRLITPPGGLVFDPFTGSGSTGRGAVLEGFDFIGSELSPEYAAIARARIAKAADQ